jgi:hypothetical protein
MLLDLTDTELQTAAMACRSYAYRESERARAMENTDMGRSNRRAHSHSGAARRRFSDPKKEGRRRGPATQC